MLTVTVRDGQTSQRKVNWRRSHGPVYHRTANSTRGFSFGSPRLKGSGATQLCNEQSWWGGGVERRKEGEGCGGGEGGRGHCEARNSKDPDYRRLSISPQLCVVRVSGWGWLVTGRRIYSNFTGAADGQGQRHLSIRTIGELRCAGNYGTTCCCF